MITTAVNAPNPNQPVQTNKDLSSQDIFLKLLVAQMQNQDPMNPQDPTEQTTQLAQFNMVDQQTNTNTLLEELKAALSGGDQASQLIPYLGHQVRYNSDQVHFDGNTAQDISIKMNESASDTQLVITNAFGSVIRHLHNGPIAAGETNFNWNGRDDQGFKAPIGDYLVKTIAMNQYGDPVQSEVYLTGNVSSIRNTVSGQEMMINGQAVQAYQVTEIK